MCAFNLLQWSLSLFPREDYTGPWELPFHQDHPPGLLRQGFSLACYPAMRLPTPGSSCLCLPSTECGLHWSGLDPLTLRKMFYWLYHKNVLSAWMSQSTLKRCLAQSHFIHYIAHQGHQVIGFQFTSLWFLITLEPWKSQGLWGLKSCLPRRMMLWRKIPL